MPGWEEFSRIKKCFIVDIDWCGEEREGGRGSVTVSITTLRLVGGQAGQI